MERARIIQYLRIAVIALCLTACVLLVAACFALPYSGANVVLMRHGGPGLTVVEIYQGKLSLSWEPRVPYRPEWAGQRNRHGFRYSVYSDGSWHVWAPLWAVGALLAGAIAPFAAAPWLRWQFSLRTLLVATTLIAVGMGMVIYVAR